MKGNIHANKTRENKIDNMKKEEKERGQEKVNVQKGKN